MSFTFGNRFRISIFGQSHSEKIGVVTEGLPAGIKIDEAALARFMERRASRSELTTLRREADEVHFVSGITGGKTNGAPLCAEIENTNIQKGDYENLKNVPRPGHADFCAYMAYGENRDTSGGGRFSGRMTAPLCIAGGIFKQLLEEKGIYIGSHILSVGDIYDTPFNAVSVSKNDFPDKKEIPVINDGALHAIKALVKKVRDEGDSIGGRIECAVCGLEAGIGETYFDSLESRISQTVFAIPAVKAIGFGIGDKAAELRGSENNDAFEIINGAVKTQTNNHGGILGGIASGMPLIFTASIKPTPSIAKPQKSVDLAKMENTVLEIQGRHDPCIVLRATPCIEAAAAIAIAEFIL